LSDVPIEDEYAYNVTRQIEDYFRNLGFDVVPIPISRNQERQEPYDWRYELRDLNKIFMLQFKRPIPHSRQLSWELREHQHNAMINKPYIFYCLPKSKERNEMRVMLYRCLFKRASFQFVRVLTPPMLRYCDGWGSFAAKVIQCRYGLRLDIGSEEDVNMFKTAEINFEESIILIGLSFINNRIKIFADERIFKQSEK
jgi:hypothetical protein